MGLGIILSCFLDLSELCLLPAVKDKFMKEIQAIAKDSSLPGWEVPVDIVLEPCSFTVENGLLTSTLKKSRPRFEMKYKDLLEDMYEQMNNPTSQRSADKHQDFMLGIHFTQCLLLYTQATGDCCV